LSQAHTIVLIGFASFEKVTFESFFRLAARRPPGYALIDDISQAQLAVVNADDPAVLGQCIAARPTPHVLLIGGQDGGTGWPIQRRPLNLMKVLAAVESLLNSAAASHTVPAALMPMGARPAARPAVQTVAGSRPSASPATAVSPPEAAAKSAPSLLSPSLAPAPAARPRPFPDSVARASVRTGTGTLPSADSMGVSDHFMGHSMKSIQPAHQADVDHILVVDDSDIALKFMRNRLTRFGFQADLVNSGEDALAKMNTKPYKFVFLDVMMEGLDGYQTCRAIKQRKYSDGKPPVVVMLTSRGGTIDKIRGTLAGCDAYLTKPLNERDLIAVLAKHDRSVARGFQETNVGDSASSGFARSA
jgi:two-component system, cell cycle response regulator